MSRRRTTVMLILMLLGSGADRVGALRAQEPEPSGRWTFALELGELPLHGSFKVGFSLGYRFNDHVWTGLVYQLPDAIQRNETSFNASSLGLEGLVRSSEDVGQRGYFQARLRPHRYSPYLSVGAVFNDRDTEVMVFDARGRRVGAEGRAGPLHVTLTRPAGLRPALGLGYEWTSSGGVSAFAEWSGWWIRGAPDPELLLQGEDLTADFRTALDDRLRSHFVSSLFNTYHIFQMGVGISQ